MIEKIEGFGGILVKTFHLFALFVIGGTVVWSANEWGQCRIFISQKARAAKK